jgi:hypothetical protein
MWLEAILTREDLAEVLKQFFPVKIYLHEEGKEGNEKRWLMLGQATHVALAAEEGLRVTCPAELSWSIAGMGTAMKLDELRVLLVPRIVKMNKGEVLELQIQVEEADFHSLPGFVDATIVKAVNAALATKQLSWNFTETLTRTVGLGKMFDPVEALRLEVQWGKLRIGAEALALVASFDIGFVRGD